MAALRAVRTENSARARRWDALILGGGVSALVAAARLGMQGQRVAVVEEATAMDRPPPLREPFFLAGARDGGLLETVMRELKLPLIDRRRIVPERVAYQVIGSDLRLEVGEGALTANEWVAWGLAKPELAHAVAADLASAAENERSAMLGAAVIRGRRASGSSSATGSRGLPAVIANAGDELGNALAAQVRALSNLATQPPSLEACARLLGAPLSGGAAFREGPPYLVDLLRRRVESVYAEFRTLRSDFDLVSVAGVPGIQVEGSGEVWLGRVLLIARPAEPLASCLASREAQALLAPAPAVRRRLAVHFRVDRDVLPEGLSERFIIQAPPGAPDPQTGIVAGTLHPRVDRMGALDLVARSVLEPGEDPEERAARIESQLEELMPFSQGGLERLPLSLPRWDDDDWLEDPARGAGWPTDAEFRVSSRPPVYRLERSAVAGLGLEGDLLLGWRAGETLAAELA